MNCSNSKEQLTIVEHIHYDYSEENEAVINFLHQLGGMCEYDSIIFSDGSWAIYKCKSAPMNSLLEIFDKEGRLLATESQTSECYPQYVVYNYDPKDRLTNLIVSVVADFPDIIRAENKILAFRQQITDIDYSNPDTARYEQINIKYNAEGDVTKVYKMWQNEEIVALQGYVLRISMEPCASFWESDLDGGEYIFKVVMHPKNTELTDFYVSYYADFYPTFQQKFEDDVWVKSILYPNPSYVEHVAKEMMEFEEDGDKHIYTWSSENEEKQYRTIWKKQLPYMEQVVSPYQTVLKQIEYNYDKSLTDVEVVHKEYNYQKKNLEIRDTESLSVKEMMN
ncbi:MAG: hypothetical protein IJ417_01510, partial [Bacteroidaceae bacterium]|nr:hypothetical protein [Bacteroidaceae bacterium]